jgi:hypothetical protein
LSNANAISRVEREGGSELHTINKSAIGAAQVFDNVSASLPGNPGMATRGFGVLQDNFQTFLSTQGDLIAGNNKTHAGLSTLPYNQGGSRTATPKHGWLVIIHIYVVLLVEAPV